MALPTLGSSMTKRSQSNQTVSKFESIDCVLYECSCKKLLSIYHLYFCRNCVTLRCSDCLLHEIDNYYCPHCLKNPAEDSSDKPTEVHHSKTCAECYSCPYCHHALSKRATNVQVTDPDDSEKTISKKVFYLNCGCCRWSTRDSGLPDSGNLKVLFPQPHLKSEEELNEVRSYYEDLAIAEKQLIDQKNILIGAAANKNSSYQYMHRMSPMTSIDTSSISRNPSKGTLGSGSFLGTSFNLTAATRNSSSRYRVSLQQTHESVINRSINIDALLKGSPSAIPVDEEEELPENYFTKTVDLDYVTNLDQRFTNPGHQPETLSEMRPKPVKLVIKCSKRCKGCGHNLSKPHENVAQIKFKIQSIALHYVPEIRIEGFAPLSNDEESFTFLHRSFMTPAIHQKPLPVSSGSPFSPHFQPPSDHESSNKKEWKMGIPQRIILTLSNPLSTDLNVVLLPNIASNDDAVVDGGGDRSEEESCAKSMLKYVNATVELPQTELFLSAKDDIAEFDDIMIGDETGGYLSSGGNAGKFNDDPEVIAFRSYNKVGIFVMVTPNNISHNNEDKSGASATSATSLGDEKTSIISSQLAKNNGDGDIHHQPVIHQSSSHSPFPENIWISFFIQYEYKPPIPSYYDPGHGSKERKAHIIKLPVLMDVGFLLGKDEKKDG